jgi:hypothetical protein
VGATVGLIAAMLSIEVRIAEPIAVPRAVVKLSIASINASLSVVGGTCRPATPAKATRPILVCPSWDSMKETAASWATVSRLGSTSVEHMDPETSIASMIVVELDGTGTVACGRAAPTPSVAKPRRSNRVGMSRVHLVRGGSADRTRAIEVTRTAARRRCRRNNQVIPQRIGMISRDTKAQGQLKVITRAFPCVRR